MSVPMSELVHPGLLLVLAGIASCFVRGVARSALLLAAPLAALWALWSLPEGVVWQGEYLGLDVAPLVVDALSRLFATVFLIMAFGGALFALGQRSRFELGAAFVYAGSAVGVTLAAD